jgi:hypothetical protein
MLALTPSAILPALLLALLPLLLALLLALLPLLLALLLALLSPILPAFLPVLPSPSSGSIATSTGPIVTSTGPSSAALAGPLTAASVSSAHVRCSFSDRSTRWRKLYPNRDWRNPRSFLRVRRTIRSFWITDAG